MSAAPERADRATRRAVRRIRTFARRHAAGTAGEVRGVVEHTGQSLMRVVLVGADGVYGDVLVHGRERADSALRLAGVTTLEATDRAFGTRLRTRRYEWARMAGLQLGRR